jgi:hypothetical protein
MKRVEVEDGQGDPVTVVVSSFNILQEALVRPISFHERSSSRRQSARVHESKRRRHNQSTEVDKTEFEPPQKTSASQSKKLSADQEKTKRAAADLDKTKGAAAEDKPRKSLSGVAEGPKAVVRQVVKGTRIPLKDFIDISTNRGRMKTKTDFSLNQISNYKATFPESAKASYFIKPGEPSGLKSQCLLMTQLSTTTTANHTWLRHASRMRVQSMGTMSPAIVSYPLNEELTSSHLRKTSTELILQGLSQLRSAKLSAKLLLQ